MRSTARIFVYGRRWLDWSENGKVVISETVSIDAIARSGDVTFEFRSELREPQYADVLEKMLQQTSAREETNAPAEAGFCFYRGLIKDPLPPEWHEFTVAFVGIKNHPDVSLALSTTAGLKPGKSLLQRDAENSIKHEYFSHFHSLRRGIRSLNGVPGEEVLDRILEPSGVVAHGFMWDSLGRNDDVYLPSLSFELSTGRGRPGKPVHSSLSDSEALALWDKISSTLRRRPVGINRSGSSATAADGDKNG